MDHSGEVICKLKNDSGEVLCKARLKVLEDLSKKGNRPLFLEEPENKEVTEGGEVTFECVVSGMPDPDDTWLFNGREIHVRFCILISYLTELLSIIFTTSLHFERSIL